MQGRPAAEKDAQAARFGRGVAEDAATRESQRPTVLADLEQRIHELEFAEEERFGRFTRFDWVLCVAGSLLLPYLLYLWFWP